MTTILVIWIFLAFITNEYFLQKVPSKPDVFVGVDVGFGGEQDVYNVANAVKDYANLIILGSLQVTQDTATLTRVCDWLSEHGFYFIIYIGFAVKNYLPPRGPSQDFFNSTAGKWGDKFLGIYVFDEIGGKQLDAKEKPVLLKSVPDVIINQSDYTYVAETYVAEVIGDTSITVEWFNPPYPYYFMSDYGLYWFDYLSGYGTVFTEFVGNESRQTAIALCRGAAHTLSMNPAHTGGQDWGAMITWKYDDPPFLERGSELYQDMVWAYQSGATYVIVFDSAYPKNETTPLGILTDDHLTAMQQFWEYTKTNPRNGTYPADTAYVLPRDYGYGMRGPDDTIWGLWPADNSSAKIWNDVNALLSTYHLSLDIVYETRLDLQPVYLPYKHLIFWNGTEIQK